MQGSSCHPAHLVAHLLPTSTSGMCPNVFLRLHEFSTASTASDERHSRIVNPLSELRVVPQLCPRRRRDILILRPFAATLARALRPLLTLVVSRRCSRTRRDYPVLRIVLPETVPPATSRTGAQRNRRHYAAPRPSPPLERRLVRVGPIAISLGLVGIVLGVLGQTSFASRL
jgi:hypothetical protein